MSSKIDPGLMGAFMHELMELYLQEHPERANDVIEVGIGPNSGHNRVLKPGDPDYPYRPIGCFDMRPNRFKGS